MRWKPVFCRLCHFTHACCLLSAVLPSRALAERIALSVIACEYCMLQQRQEHANLARLANSR